MKKILLLSWFIFIQILICISQTTPARSLETIKTLLQKTKKDTARISLLLDASILYLKRPGNLKTDMDSVTWFINQAMQLTNTLHSAEWEGKCFLVYSYIYRELNDREKGKIYAQKAIENLSKEGKKNDLGDAYVELARYYDLYTDNDLAEKIKLNEKAAQLFSEAGNQENEAATLKHVGDLSMLNGDTKKALVELQKALNIFKEIGYTELQGVYDLLSSVSIHSGNYAEALRYGLLALKTAEDLKDSSAQLSTIYNHLGVTMYYLTKLEQSAQYYQKALSIVLRNKDTASVFVIVNNIVNVYNKANEPSKAIEILKSTENEYILKDIYSQVFIYSSFVSSYIKIKEYDLAIPYVSKLLDISIKHHVTDAIQENIYPSIIYYFLATKQYSQMTKYCAFEETFCKKNAVLKNQVANYWCWYQADSALGNFALSLSHYQMLVTIKDSLFNEAKAKQISELQIQYETEKKDKDIQLLTKQGSLQKNKLQQATILRNVTFAGVALLIIIVALLYNRYRLKQRTNKKLELQQKEINQINEQLKEMLAEKEWWLKEVHHRVKNNLHTIICLLESQAMYLEKDALQAIEKSQHRIYAMSLIHQKLYQNEDVQSIDMSVYLEEFIGYLKDSFDAEKIDFNLQVEPVHLNLQQAIPVALIINEGVTNSLKYAFDSENAPTIWIYLTQANDTVTLIIADNGKGFILKEEDEGKSLGMQLIRGLSKELRGFVHIDSNRGTKLTIEFKRAPVKDHIPVLQEDKIG